MLSHSIVHRIDMTRSKLHVNNPRETGNVTKIWLDIDLRVYMYVRIIRSENILNIRGINGNSCNSKMDSSLKLSFIRYVCIFTNQSRISWNYIKIIPCTVTF